MSYNLEQFKDGLKELQIELNEKQISQFLKYYELLVETNKVMNLTAITEFDEVVEKHFLDSLSLCRVYDLKIDAKILDLGTGAGFPGIPLKIAFPNLELVLADSLNKRIKFLNQVIDELELKDITAVHARAEELGRNKDYREQFDVCVSRAVANLSSLSEYCIPFVKVGGKFISYKSGSIDMFFCELCLMSFFSRRLHVSTIIKHSSPVMPSDEYTAFCMMRMYSSQWIPQ